jgi:hypothetical protein
MPILIGKGHQDLEDGRLQRHQQVGFFRGVVRHAGMIYNGSRYIRQR